MSLRLDTLDKALSDRIAGASERKRLDAAQTACSFAVRQNNVDDRIVLRALNSILLDESVAEDLVEQLTRLAERLDAEYFQLNESDDHTTAMRFFGQARAVQSLLFALFAPDSRATCDAVYEAAMSLDDPAPVLRGVWSSLERQSREGNAGHP